MNFWHICTVSARIKVYDAYIYTSIVFDGKCNTTADVAAWRPYKMAHVLCSHDSSIYKYLYKNMALKLYSDL